jgi:hypothetical protein
MYQMSIPVMIRMLGNLKKILKKAEKHAVSKHIETEVLLNARLAPDMFPLKRQIQIATDTAKGCAARLAGKSIPVYKDNEKTFNQLYQRIDRTITLLKKTKASEIDGSENKEIILEFPSATLKFRGEKYLLNFVLPNFYFHITTAYAILRHNGVAIGKRDFIGPRPG